MKMNMSKVLVGGIIAGIVQNVIDFVTQTYLLGPKAIVEMDAFKAGMGSAMKDESPVPYILLDLLMGIILVWLYAAIRPRFGAGPRTAAYAAVFVWVVSGIAYYGWLSMGMMSGTLWAEFSIVALITCIISTMVGAKFYSEEGTA